MIFGSTQPRLSARVFVRFAAVLAILGAGLGVFATEAASAAPKGGGPVKVKLQGSTLVVDGGNGGDTITIRRNAGDPTLLEVDTNGNGPAEHQFNLASVASIVVNGNGGDDTVTFDESAGALPAGVISGGNGRDLLIGGSGADTISGGPGNDVILGKGGFDFLSGDADNDTLTGGDGNDVVNGGTGDDVMIWNPGDDSDLNEGGDGIDTVVVNGGNGAETFTTTANGTRVRFDRITPAPFNLDIGTSERLNLNANGGNDIHSATGNLAALIQITVDGGTGDDTILGSNGNDLLLGGDGDDLVDGQQGNDTVLLGAGDDVFQWDPGDGSDTVEGQDGTDTLRFSGSNIGEQIDITANGGRVRFTRNIAAIVMDLDGVETLHFEARGGADLVSVGSLAGTDVTSVEVDQAALPGGTTGDAAADTVVVNGGNGADVVDVYGSGTSYSVVGLSATVAVTNSEGALDALVLNGLAGNDSLSAATVPAGVVNLTFDGGTGNDVLRGSYGLDLLIAGDGDDFVDGQQGNDLAFLGAGNDVFQWDPGDGSDTVEGQDGADTLLFFGSNAAENIDILPNGGRVFFVRNVAAITMDLDDVETIHFNASGGADNVVVGSLVGTDVTKVEVSLAAFAGGGDAQTDRVTVNGTNGDDTIAVAGSGSTVSVSGLSATVEITDAESALDGLTVNAQGGADAVNANGLPAGVIALTVLGGLGNDTLIGSHAADLLIGGDGNDVLLGGEGDDVMVWNPGDDNDVFEGQDGTDTLLFNGANITENINISANGGRVRFTRDIAAVVLDLNDVETVHFNAFGGADNIFVNSLYGTDVTTVEIDLHAAGGIAGDLAADNVHVYGTDGVDVISVAGNASLVSVTGLAATVAITGHESLLDVLRVHTLAGADIVGTGGLVAGTIQLVID